MKIVVNGAGGQLGQDVISCFSGKHDVIGLTKSKWDITNASASREILETHRPDVLIHCAAYTHVDLSEDHPLSAYQVNVEGTRVVARLCHEMGIYFVYISTDYVFNGSIPNGYTEEDFPHPINVYGKTKRLGEKWTMRLCDNYLVVRTSWLYARHGTNFVNTILNKARTNEPLGIVADQIGSPTSTRHLCKHLLLLLEGNVKGVIHLANTGSCSWYTLAKKILEHANISVEIRKIASKELPRKAVRPIYSILRSKRLYSFGINEMPFWEDALQETLEGRE